jgi:hypothetical protein
MRNEWGGGGGGGGGSRCRLLNSCTGCLNQRLTEPGPKISFTLSYEGLLVSKREHSLFKGKEEKV